MQASPQLLTSYQEVALTWMSLRLLHLWLRYQTLAVLRFSTVSRGEIFLLKLRAAYRLPWFETLMSKTYLQTCARVSFFVFLIVHSISVLQINLKRARLLVERHVSGFPIPGKERYCIFFNFVHFLKITLIILILSLYYL